MPRILGLFFCLFFSTIVSAETFHLARSDGSTITYYLDIPNNTQSFSIFAMLQGSDCQNVGDKYPGFKAFFTNVLKMAILTVEKPGLPTAEPGCPREYFIRNTIDQRLEDFQAVMGELRTNVSAWDRRLYLEGGSEGAVVGGLLTPLIPEIKAAMLLAGGGGRTMAEELLLLRQKELVAQGASENQISSALSEMRANFEEIRTNPTSDLTWYGETNTYKWWSSILFRSLVDPLQSSLMPLYIVQGAADESVPVESADELISALGHAGREEVTYVRREGLSHSWVDSSGQPHAEQIFSSTIIWLMAFEDQEIRSRLMELLRQNPEHPDLPELANRMAAIDQRNTLAMKVLIGRSGFPLISSHGAQANRDGWLLVQHADQDVNFQRTILGILETALTQHDTNPPDVAYLADRVMVNERFQSGQSPEQHFGTQGRVVDGCWVPWTILELPTVDARRTVYELEPLADYIRRNNDLYGDGECQAQGGPSPSTH